MIRQSTGVEGLDKILLGGLLSGRIYMVSGQPGVGKTTFGLQFLMAGARHGESTLFVTLSESEAELRENAALHAWDLTGIQFLDLHPGVDDGGADQPYSIFHPADVELIPLAQQIQSTLDQIQPTRIVIDSLTQIRMLSRDALRYRRQIMTLKSLLLQRDITTIFLDQTADPDVNNEIASIVQGVIRLSWTKGQKGMLRRAIEIQKYRGSAYLEGEHPLRIIQGGIVVFPRLLARNHSQRFERSVLPTGVPGFDQMLNGGLDRGTCTLVTGNAGVGKTTLGMSVLIHAAQRGERGVLYTFNEEPAEIIFRSEATGLRAQQAIDAGLLVIHKVNPLLLYPEEFASWVRDEVEQRQTRVLMIDSLNGYDQSMPTGNYLSGHMHQLSSYLNQMGVTSLLINEQSAVVGGLAATQSGLSYLADAIIVIRYYKDEGMIAKAVGVLKKRTSDHEKSFRALQITERGVVVGKPLPNLRTILRGRTIRTATPSEHGVNRG